MNAVDELRCLIEDRGVNCEWRESDDSITWSDSDGTAFRARNEFSFKGRTGKVIVYGLTPEQAIAATLGAGTLQAENDKLRKELKDEVAENIWAREFLNGIANKIKLANARSLVNYTEIISAENAKLRELVRIAGTYCVNGYCDPGDGCPLLVDGKCQLTDRMRELGVEV